MWAGRDAPRKEGQKGHLFSHQDFSFPTTAGKVHIPDLTLPGSFPHSGRTEGKLPASQDTAALRYIMSVLIPLPSSNTNKHCKYMSSSTPAPCKACFEQGLLRVNCLRPTAVPHLG